MSLNISLNSYKIEVRNIVEPMSKRDIKIDLDRILLRNVQIEDADNIFKFAGDYGVAEMMNGSIPHPYPKSMAIDWVKKHLNDSAESSAISWAIILKENDAFIGSIQIRKIDEKSVRLSYWLGEPFWGKGLMSEAIRGVVGYCFEKIGLEEIEAEHFKRNPASGKVLLKAGFSYLGSVSKEEKLLGRVEIFEQYSLGKERLKH